MHARHSSLRLMLLLAVLVPAAMAPPAQAQFCIDFVPTMTSNTTPQGVVTRSGVISSSYEAYKAFDSSLSSMWISEVWETPAWIAYDLGFGRFVNQYSIKYSNGSITTRAPKAWQLQGSNGGSWITVDSRSNQTGWGGSETRTFQVTSPGTYTKYRLYITEDNDSRSGIVVISIGDLKLESCLIFGCNPGMVCSSETQCHTLCGGNPFTNTGDCISGCCFCL